MRWNTRPPRDGGRRLRYRLGPRRAGRWKVGPSRAARGDRTAGTGRAPPTERLQPRTFRGFRRFDFAFRLPFFRPWGTVQRGWCVFALDARAACARVCVHDGASSLSRHLLSFGRFMRSSSACTPTARRESTHSTRASSRERRDERRDERRPRPRRAQRVGPSAPQLMLGGGPSWVTSASFHRVAMMDARPCGAGPTGRLAGSTSSLRRARLFSCPLAPRPL